MSSKKPAILVFAGPNGSGKSSITEFVDVFPPYINADDVKREKLCSDLEAAQIADRLRQECIARHQSFTFETVFSTFAKVELLNNAKREGYFIKGFFVLTSDPKINVFRVKARVAAGGHDVPEDKIMSRYAKSIDLVPEFVQLCDVCHIYDNSEDTPRRIFKKDNVGTFYCWPSDLWSEDRIMQLVGFEKLL